MDEEEELMGLYAIAREELKAIESARYGLKNATVELESVAYQIRADTKTGIEGVLRHFKNENDQILKCGIESALNGLLEASTHASRSLSRTTFAWTLFFCCFGVVVGAGISFFIFSTEFNRVIASQRQILSELEDIKAQISPEKPRKSHRNNQRTK
jgi:hypothetical protein